MKVLTEMFMLWVLVQKLYLHPGIPLGDLLISYEMFYIDAALSEFERLNMWLVLCFPLCTFMSSCFYAGMSERWCSIKLQKYQSSLIWQLQKVQFLLHIFSKRILCDLHTLLSFCCCKSCNKAVKIISLI